MNGLGLSILSKSISASRLSSPWLCVFKLGMALALSSGRTGGCMSRELRT
jgi:hypothetical protein